MALPQIQVGDGMIGDASLSSIQIVQELNQHWWCTIVCRNTEDQRIPVEDLLGKPVEVKTTDDQGVEHVERTRIESIYLLVVGVAQEVAEFVDGFWDVGIA